MKRVKKLFAVLLAAMTVMALSATALAAETFTIRFTDPGFSLFAADDTPRYSVYQIFTGDLSTDETTKVTTLSNIKWGQNCASGYTQGESVSEEVLTALKAVNVAGKTDKEKLAVITQYVNLKSNPIKTANGTSDDDTIVAAGYYLIRDNGPVSGNEYSLYVVEVTNNVTITPKTSNTTSEKKIVDNGTEKDSADYDIGDEITFRLSAAITDHYDYYETYKLTFHDTLSEGLTLDASSVTVKVDGTEIESTKYTVATDADDKEDTCSFEVQFTDLKDIDSVKAGSKITVEYKATLNEDAIIGGTGNPNTLKVSYSNNPYDKTKTTDTPDNKVTVYTYKIIVNKVDENEKALANAKFTLSKNTDGTNPIGFVGTATKNTYRLAVKDDTDTVTDFTTDSTGTFTLQGLASGTYYLKETAAPSGYNTLADPVTVNISDSGTVTVGNGTEGVDAVKVVNKAGSTLPETGGIGTTIFYVLGGILMAGAVVLLVTRKRMRDAE